VTVPSVPPSTPPSGAAPSLGSASSFTRAAMVSIAATATIAAGAIGGAWLTLHAQRSVAHVDSVTRGAEIALDLGRSPGPQTNLPPPTAVVGPPAARPSSPPSIAGASSGSAGDLASERLLLDRARTDLLHGEPAAALTSVGLHARRFPRGVLSEEREALVAADRPEEARSAASRFHAAYPDSVLTAAVDAALESIP
jgi:hypothetical protein